MKIYKYFLLHNKKLKPWIKYWLYIKSKDKNYVLSDILDGTSFYLENSSNKNFNLFQINGNSMQDGTPTPTNPVEIESAGDGINLLPNEATNQTLNGLTFTVNEDKSITVNGTATANTNYTLIGQSGVATEVLKLNANQNYYNTTSIRLVYRLVNGTYGAINPGSFTLSNDLSMRHIYLSIPNGTTYNNEVIYPQIIKGTSPKAYVPYGKAYINITISNSDNTQSQEFTIPCQQPMRSIGNVRDVFIKQDGVWYEKHVIGQVVLNGSESWGFGSSGEQNINAANVYISSILISNYGQGLCNYFIRGASKTANTLRFGANDKQLWFFVKSTDFTNVNDWKTWLSTHNTEVIYQLAEPNYIECTQEQIEALESITQAYTYKQGTNINSTDETPAYLNIQYFMEV